MQPHPPRPHPRLARFHTAPTAPHARQPAPPVRAQASTEGLWPWSYDECTRPGGPEAANNYYQRISKCDADPGHGMHPYQGRGSPEVDLLETNLAYRWNHGENNGTAPLPPNATALQTSLQITPRVPGWMRPQDRDLPDSEHPWYSPLAYGDTTIANPNFYGMWNYDSLSAVHTIGDDAYSPQTPQTVSFEYATGEEGYMRWSHNGEMVFEVRARAAAAVRRGAGRRAS